MNDISLLKELGLSEVARRTHIEAEYLGYIVDKSLETGLIPETDNNLDELRQKVEKN